jgi:hypothetical protein
MTPLLKRLIQTAALTTFVALASPTVTSANRTYEQGILLEENTEYPCMHECGPLETVYFRFCIQSGSNVYLGRLFDSRFNYDPSKFFPQIGKTIQFRHDEKRLWLVRPDGKEFGINQRYTDGVFRDTRCISELHRHLLQDSPRRTRPSGVAPDAVYVPLTSKIGYWTKCSLAPDRAIVCFARSPKGEEFSHVYQSLPEVHTNSDLAIDPLRTNYDRIVLSSQRTLTRK